MTPIDSTMPQRLVSWKNNQTFLIAVLFLLSFSVYLNTYRNQFTYDDVPVVLEDHRLRSLHTLPSLFTHDYMMTPDHNLYRPLPMLTMAANYLLFGESPWSYRVVNQLLHCLNTILLFLFLGNFYKERTGFRFLASAIFAVHPAATETVNLIVYRAELLAFTFSLLAIHLYILRDRSRYYSFGSVALYFLAMLSKESAMILPLFLLLYHLYFERGRGRDFIKGMVPYVAAAALIAGIRYAALGAFGPQGIQQFFHGIPRLPAAFTMLKVIAYYWRIVFWPVNLQMNYDFSDFPIAYSLFDARVLFSLLFLISIAAAALWIYKKNRTVSYFMLWPLIALLPVMNIIVPTGVLIAVRLMYLPMAGFCVLLAALLCLPTTFPEKPRLANREGGASPVFYGYTGLFLIILSALTISRNADFKNTETLFKKDLALSPRNVLSMKFLAPELPLDEAEVLLKKAAEINPSDTAVLSMLGEIYEKQGDHAAAEALQRRSLGIGPTYGAYKRLGIVLSNTGRLDEAEEQFRKVIQLKPFWSGAYEDLAVVFLRKGDREAAVDMINKALNLNPDSADAHNLLGIYYKETGNFGAAAGAFQRAVRLYRQADKIQPGLYEAMYNLADAYDRLDPEAAVRAWEDYIRAAEQVYSEKAWVERAKNRVAALSRGSGRK